MLWNRFISEFNYCFICKNNSHKREIKRESGPEGKKRRRWEGVQSAKAASRSDISASVGAGLDPPEG